VSILGAKKTFCVISSGQYYTIGLDKNGQVWGWGYNIYGQIGDNTTVYKYTPVSILGAKKTFCKITTGYNFTSGIDNNGQVWSWGYNNFGQLGDNSIPISRITPVSILGAKKTFCKISVGTNNNYTTGIDNYGLIWGWGYNNFGQLGDNNRTQRNTPVSISGAKKTFCIISNGNNHSVGIDKNGQVWCWGLDNFGQLGNNSVINKCTPVSISGVKKTFCNISSGIHHTIVIDHIGQVWSWGYNINGQIGDNTVTNRCTPVSILGSKKTFCNISSGQYFAIGLDKNGQVWGWGYNSKGQIGDNTVTSRRTPVSILGSLKTFCNIIAGASHTIGIDNNGQVWSWGNNNTGQLGDNTTSSRRTPVSILGAKKTFCKISAGPSNSAGIDKNGQVWGWGYNSKGQLGDNTIIQKYTPVSILGVKKTFCSIISGTEYTIGIDKNNLVWGWGYNNVGQITTSYNSTTPLRVCNF